MTDEDDLKRRRQVLDALNGDEPLTTFDGDAPPWYVLLAHITDLAISTRTEHVKDVLFEATMRHVAKAAGPTAARSGEEP